MLIEPRLRLLTAAAHCLTLFDIAEPPRCRNPQHTAPERHRRTCPVCCTWTRWRNRRNKCRLALGISAYTTNTGRLRNHILALHDAGMTTLEIAEDAGVSDSTIESIRNGQRRALRNVADAILNVTAPPGRGRLIPDSQGRRYLLDSTGTARRNRALALEGHGFADQAAMLGWHRDSLSDWSTGRGVRPAAAQATADLYDRLDGRPGSNTVAAAFARSKGWHPRRYFTADNIDDPTYNPVALISHVGPRRRLQALAAIAQGPEQVAALIGETADDVHKWTLGAGLPAYTVHLISDAYETLSGLRGPDTAAVALAAEHRWPAPLDWEDVDIDDPVQRPRRAKAARQDYLESNVLDAVSGRITVAELTVREKIEVVTRLHRLGWSDARIGAWLRWSPERDLAKARACVRRFRELNRIGGFGGNERFDDIGMILWGAAA